MAKLTDIPYEIIRLILYRTTGNKRYSRLNSWKSYIPYLSICRLIRIVAIPIYYSHLEVYIPYTNGELAEISTNGSEDSDTIIFESNIRLILQNGYEDLVTHMDIHGGEMCFHRLIWVFWAEQFISNSGNSTTDDMIKLLQNEVRKALPEGNKISNWLSPERYVIMLLQQKFPNIKSISLESLVLFSSKGGMIYSLAQEYANKLVQLSWTAPAIIFEKLTLLGLKKFRMDFLNCSRFIESPTIVDPRSLKKLWIKYDNEFSWEIFKVKPWPICFPALEELRLENVYRRFAMDNLCKEKLVFPTLTKLKIIDIRIHPESAACLMQSKTLRALHYEGDVDSALELCQNISSIDTFEFKITMNMHRERADITDLTNRLFAMTQRIKHVKFHMAQGMIEFTIDYLAIRWQFLTHLTVVGDKESLHYIESFANMNTLISATFRLRGSKIQDVLYNYFISLTAKEPSTCSIKKFSLVCESVDANEDWSQRNSNMVKSLQHYLPKLEIIFINKCEFEYNIDFLQ